MTAEVQVVGGPQAMADLRRWAGELAPEVDKATEPFADRLADRVRGRVPVLTGQLAGSVEPVHEDQGVGVALGAGVPYAGWIEFGGSRGRPFVPEGRYLGVTAIEQTEAYAAEASKAAEDSVRRFRWNTPSA